MKCLCLCTVTCYKRVYNWQIFVRCIVTWCKHSIIAILAFDVKWHVIQACQRMKYSSCFSTLQKEDRESHIIKSRTRTCIMEWGRAVSLYITNNSSQNTKLLIKIFISKSEGYALQLCCKVFTVWLFLWYNCDTEKN